MRVLAISDVEDARLYENLPGQSGSFDVVVSCGDLKRPYLGYVATFANAPLLYVPGNHDVGFDVEPVAGGIPLDGRIVEVAGLRFAGLGGSMLYREGVVGYTEPQMRRRCTKLAIRARLVGGIDVLVTHAPPRGYGDLGDLAHCGFESFNDLLYRLKPQVMFHGHVHLDYGRLVRERMHPSGTRLVNTCGSQVVEITASEGVQCRSCRKEQQEART